MYITLLLDTITATTAMNLLSYAFSATFRELYKEPLLLKYLLQRFGSKLTSNTEEVLGWLIHYSRFSLCALFSIVARSR